MWCVQARTLRHQPPINQNHAPWGHVKLSPPLYPRSSDLFHRRAGPSWQPDAVDHINLLRGAVRQTRRERPFAINARVDLLDHLHCVLTLPTGGSDYPTRWRLIKTRFSRQMPAGPLRRSHVLRGERGIWQRRYWEHHIRDHADLAAHVRQCWMNSVKHGFVRSPEEWPYSTIQRDIANGTYDPKNAGHSIFP